MYQYMFVENKKKKNELLQRSSEEGEIKEAGSGSNVAIVTSNRTQDIRYLSALNTRRNPDVLVPGGKFLKGNQYFKGDQKIPAAPGSGDEKSSEKEDSDQAGED